MRPTHSFSFFMTLLISKFMIRSANVLLCILAVTLISQEFSRIQPVSVARIYHAVRCRADCSLSFDDDCNCCGSVISTSLRGPLRVLVAAAHDEGDGAHDAVNTYHSGEEVHAPPRERNKNGDSHKVSDDEVFLRIARDFRTASSLTRASRFYEFALEKGRGNLRPLVQLELAELLEQDPSLSTTYNYLDLLIESATAGNPNAQHKVAIMYSTGIAARDLVPMDALRGLTLEYMSALAGHPTASMGMGYRYLNGIGVAQSCDLALPFYEYAANHAAQIIELTGKAPHPDRMKLADAIDPQAKWLKREGTQELTDYYAHLSENGDTSAALMLGNLYAMGTRLIPQNEVQAIRYLNISAVQGRNAAAMGQLGYILAKLYHSRYYGSKPASLSSLSKWEVFRLIRIRPGDGSGGMNTGYDNEAISLDVSEIQSLLQYSSQKGDANGVVGMGFMYYHGFASRGKNITKAVEYFQKALGSHLDAGFYLGEIYMGQMGDELNQLADLTEEAISGGFAVNAGHPRANARREQTHATRSSAVSVDVNAALRSYNMAAQLGNVLAQHRLGHLLKRGVGNNPHHNCHAAVQSFKLVSERGYWMDGLAHGHRLYYEGNKLSALKEFAELAAVGVESAQYNAAYILSSSSNSGHSHSSVASSRFDGRDLYASSLPFRCPPVDKSPLGKYDKDNDLRRREEHQRLLSQRYGHRWADKHENRPTAFSETSLNYSEFFHQRMAKDNDNSTSRGNGTVFSPAHLSLKQWRKFLEHYDPRALEVHHTAPQRSGNNISAKDHLKTEAYNVKKLVEALKRSQSNLLSEKRRCSECESRAMLLFDLCAAQGNAEAYLQLGDFHYYQRAGISDIESTEVAVIPNDESNDGSNINAVDYISLHTDFSENNGKGFVVLKEVDSYEKSETFSLDVNWIDSTSFYTKSTGAVSNSKWEAAMYYQRAADLRHTQALFNLGLMHESGDGVRQDFHLAQRYYDLAAGVDPKAKVPRDLALLMLQGHKLFSYWFGPTAANSFLNNGLVISFDLRWLCWMLTEQQLVNVLQNTASSFLEIRAKPSSSIADKIGIAEDDLVGDNRNRRKMSEKSSQQSDNPGEKTSALIIEVRITVASLLGAMNLMDSAFRFHLDQLCLLYDKYMRRSVRQLSSSLYTQVQLQRNLPKWISKMFRNNNRAAGDIATSAIPPLTGLPDDVAAELGHIQNGNRQQRADSNDKAFAFLDQLHNLPVKLATIFSQHLRSVLHHAYISCHSAVHNMINLTSGRSDNRDASGRTRRTRVKSSNTASSVDVSGTTEPDGQNMIFSKDEFTLLILLLTGFAAVLLFKFMRRQIVAIL